MSELNISDITEATIRQIVSLSQRLGALAGDDFVHLEIGNPGLEASKVGVEAECESLRAGVANKYPAIGGIPALKEAGEEFLRAFLDIELPGRCIVPTVGSMQGTYSVICLLQRCDPKKDTILFINPGFPAQRSQAHLLGLRIQSFDIYDYRGSRLSAKLEEELSSGRVAGILYCNPNNPAWINLTEDELKILGEAATRHDVVILEDLAYMGMDYRQDTGTPYCSPFVPTVARYTDRYILFCSASKIFSYAGQRISMVCFSPALYDRRYEGLADFFHIPLMGNAFVFGVLYALSSGTAHSAQCAFAAMLKAAARGELNFVKVNHEYARRAEIVKRLFTDNGFHIVYDRDADGSPIADGFFFTVGYGDMQGGELQYQLMRHGVSAISLPSTGSLQQGLRACVSMISSEEEFNKLQQRLKNFNNEQRQG